MLKHMHRFSRDIDIFVSDPQYVTAFSPRVNDRAEDESTLYDEQHQYVKLYFPEGEVDFVASPIISSNPFETQQILGRTVKVETPLEIVAKDPIPLRQFESERYFRSRSGAERHRNTSRNWCNVVHAAPGTGPAVIFARRGFARDFAAIDTISYSPSYEHCVEMMQRHF